MSNYTQLKFPDQLFEDNYVAPHVEVKPGEIKINTGMNGFVQTGDSVESFRDFNKNKKDQNEPKMKMIRFSCQSIESGKASVLS